MTGWNQYLNSIIKIEDYKKMLKRSKRNVLRKNLLNIKEKNLISSADVYKMFKKDYFISIDNLKIINEKVLDESFINGKKRTSTKEVTVLHNDIDKVTYIVFEVFSLDDESMNIIEVDTSTNTVLTRTFDENKTMIQMTFYESYSKFMKLERKLQVTNWWNSSDMRYFNIYEQNKISLYIEFMNDIRSSKCDFNEKKAYGYSIKTGDLKFIEEFGGKRIECK